MTEFPVPLDNLIAYVKALHPGGGPLENVSDAFTTEADVSLTRRSSITFVGGYSFLHYLDSGLLNSDSATGRIGYNYLLNREDTIAAISCGSGS